MPRGPTHGIGSVNIAKQLTSERIAIGKQSYSGAVVAAHLVQRFKRTTSSCHPELIFAFSEGLHSQRLHHDNQHLHQFDWSIRDTCFRLLGDDCTQGGDNSKAQQTESENTNFAIY